MKIYGICHKSKAFKPPSVSIMVLLVKTCCIETKHVCMGLMRYPLETEFCWKFNELIRVKWPVGCSVGLGTPGDCISGVFMWLGKIFSSWEGTMGVHSRKCIPWSSTLIKQALASQPNHYQPVGAPLCPKELVPGATQGAPARMTGWQKPGVS